MDALFGGCSIVGALIASGKYQFEPLPPSKVYNAGFNITTTNHAIFLALILVSSHQVAQHHWVPVGAAVNGTYPALYINSASGTGTMWNGNIEVLDSHTIRIANGNGSLYAAPSMGYIYEV